MTQATTSKLKILRAAAEVADEYGATHLTLERVAETAQLSKGGLLYHFPNKRSLLVGMLNYLLNQADARVAEHMAAPDQQAQPLARALILAESEQDPSERAMAQALLTAAAEDPELLAPAKVKMAQWFDAVQQENSRGLILLLAVEGLRFLSMLDLLPTAQCSRARFYELLLDSADGSQA